MNKVESNVISLHCFCITFFFLIYTILIDELHCVLGCCRVVVTKWLLQFHCKVQSPEILLYFDLIFLTFENWMRFIYWFIWMMPRNISWEKTWLVAEDSIKNISPVAPLIGCTVNCTNRCKIHKISKELQCINQSSFIFCLEIGICKIKLKIK